MATEIGALMRMLHLKPISVPPCYKILVGSYEGALLLAQIMYWYSVMDEDFYKTNEDFKSELFMTDREFKRAKGQIKAVPFIKTYLKGVPAKTFYSVNWDVYISVMKRLSSEQVGTIPYQPVGTPSYQLDGTDAVPTITESTSENTTNNIYADFLESFNKLTGRKFRILDEKTKRQLRARLKEGFTPDEILGAAKRCSQDEFHVKNPKYLTPEFITRADKLQMYMASGVASRQQRKIEAVNV